ncbi:hypothetical protein MLD38_022403 [Melastoma candidum]|uniref:Uncharacterized protein n=1 Tax=Melastoma candidum TaxID=119954 RepID=A0ACB9QKY5_9MYRT|nr:hypothetical protein MLD38_022403 [Melastoma candidum]
MARYGEFCVGYWKRLVGDNAFRQLNLSKVLPVLMALIFIALVIESSSWMNLVIFRSGDRVGFDDSLRRTNTERGLDRSSVGRRLLGLAPRDQEKMKALNKLEDVLLEPPRAASERSRTYQRRTKYLSDLMGDDTLKSYPRRLFIDVGQPGSDGAGWFARTYPTRSLDFETYEIEMSEEEDDAGRVKMGVSEWVKERVREEEFVVMKAEAEAVEEMVKSRAMRLVDELFLECRTRKKVDDSNNNTRKKKAYWECLALYGRLRDEGVAVHQWWG